MLLLMHPGLLLTSLLPVYYQMEVLVHMPISFMYSSTVHSAVSTLVNTWCIKQLIVDSNTQVITAAVVELKLYTVFEVQR
jgi:acyl-ACP thioesterase